MIAMHYRISLPADYDMEIIRVRVAEKGAALDDLPGLAFKAYLIRELDTHGDNAYAPFYVWEHSVAMAKFLLGDGFRQLCSDFGRPVVKTWVGAKFFTGSSLGSEPRSARLSSRLIAPGGGLDAAIETESAVLEAFSDTHLHSALVAFDLRTWEVVRFELWPDASPDDGDGQRFSALHLSAPGRWNVA